MYLCQNGRTDEGVKHFEAAAKNALYRTPEAAYTNAGVCLRAAKRDEEARPYFIKALQAKPNFPDAVLQLADLEFHHGELPQARALLDAYFGNFGETPDLLLLARAGRALAEGSAGRAALRAQAAAGFPRLRPDPCAGRSRPQPRLNVVTRAGGSVGIGARLRAARERQGLTVLQAAEKLHVDAKVLESLEAEDFAPLGADVYVRGHLRRYAELIGESSGELQDLYASAGLAVHPDLTRIPRVERPSESSHLVLPALLAVVGLALAGVLWWVFTLPGARPQALVTPPPAAADAPAAGAARPARDTGTGGRGIPAGAPARAAAPPAPGRPSA